LKATLSDRGLGVRNTQELEHISLVTLSSSDWTAHRLYHYLITHFSPLIVTPCGGLPLNIAKARDSVAFTIAVALKAKMPLSPPAWKNISSILYPIKFIPELVRP
jgi:hypothetical protein